MLKVWSGRCLRLRLTTPLRSRRLSAEHDIVIRKDRARRNLRVGLILASIALAAFVGVMLRYSVFR